MPEQTGKKEKDFVLFEYDPEHEKAVKITFSGNIKLKNGYKGTILGVKGTSKDGNTKFIRIFSQTGVLFKGDDKFTGDLEWSEVGGKKALIGWLNDEGKILSGYANEPKGMVAGKTVDSKDEKLTF